MPRSPWIGILGPVEVVPGPPVAGRAGALLVALALHANHWVSIGRLSEFVWDGEAPASAPANLRNYVTAIRRSLGQPAGGDGGPLAVGPAGVRLRVTADELDVLDHQRLLGRARAAASRGDLAAADASYTEAAGVWRGAPAEDLASSSALAVLLDRLVDGRVDVVVEHAEVRLGRGELEAVIDDLRAVTVTHPYRERAWAALMLALHRCGQTAAALDAYRSIDRRLRDELGIEPGAELRARHLEILGRDTDGVPVPVVVVPTTGTVPRQLPPPPTHFTGRAGDLAALDRLLAADGAAPVVISAIAGMGGVGKTALALHWAHQARPRFPDGDLYIDLYGFHPAETPLPAAEAAARLLTALGVDPAGMPADLAARTDELRTRLAGRRMVLVLDNARDAEQVRPLLPGATGCAVIVTSRSRMAGLVARDGGVRIALDVLSVAEAGQLLRRTIGAERTAAEPGATVALADLCGCHPLALRIAAERIADEPRRSLADCVSDLLERRRRLDLLAVPDDPMTAVRGVLEWSYAALAPTAARVFRRLGLPDGADISGAATAALLDATAAAAADVLGHLVGVHLVSQPEPGRYRMHDLVRLYAREQARDIDDEATQTAAMRRLCCWYLAGAYAARIALDAQLPPLEIAADARARPAPVFATHADALAWCDRERANLLLATQAAAAYGFDDIAWQLPAALYGYFDLRGRSDDWVGSHEIAIAAARRLGDRLAEGKTLCNLGNAHRVTRRTEQAIDCYQRALRAFEEVGYRQGEAKAYGNLSTTFGHMGRLPESVETGEAALAIFEALEDRYGAALTRMNLGCNLANSDRYAAAEPWLVAALPDFEAIGDHTGIGRTLGNLGGVLARLGRIDEGLACMDKGLAMLTEVGARMDVAWCLGEMGFAYAAAGRTGDADRAWAAADHEYELIDRPVVHAALLRRIADVHDGDAAARYRERAETLETGWGRRVS